MTQLRADKHAISNYFDRLTEGLGKRGSSFMDADAVSHDKDTQRFLFQEFKQNGEPLHPAQRMVLADLAGLPRCTVWFVERLGDGLIGWAEFGSGRCKEVITEAEYQDRFRRWWANQPAAAPQPPPPPRRVAPPTHSRPVLMGRDQAGKPIEILTADDIFR